MQRIVLIAGVLLAALAGCARPPRVSTRPLPPPLLETLRPAPPRIAPAIPRPPTPRPSWAERTPRFDERELLPPGGVARNQWRVIVVHHSANETDTPQSMDAYHRNVRKWANGLGYDFVIGNGVNTEDGRIYVGPRWTQQISGAHCKSPSGRYFGNWRDDNYFNDHGIGICLIGNFERRGPSSKQLASLELLTCFLCTETGINPAHIYGHGDVTHKTACPGRYLSARLPQLRAAVSRALQVTLDTGPPPGWPSGTDDQFAACPYPDPDGTLLVLDAPAESGDVLYGCVGDAVDHVADLHCGMLSRAVLGNVDHDHTH